MKRIILLCCIVSIGTFLVPCSSFSLMHISNSVFRFECGACHPEGPSSGYTPCISCHNNSTGGDYSDNSAIEVATHSSDYTGTDYGVWERECQDCHNPHHPNGITTRGGILDQSHVLVDLTVNSALTNIAEQTTTFQTIESININDSDWADPADWGTKTSSERGLLLVWFNPKLGKYYWYEVVSATDDGNGNATSITISNYATYFPQFWKDNPISAQLVYGMLIKDEVDVEDSNGDVTETLPVVYYSPRRMAYNENGSGNDPTPDGICQVCHTLTRFWRNDGTSATHQNGRACTDCHEHANGFAR